MGDVLYSVRGPKTLFEMTWEEVAEALQETDTIIVPVGSVEQHGPHLPLGSDSFQGMELARRCMTKLASRGIKVVAGPTIPFGVSSTLMEFPGTVTLSVSTLIAVIKDVCISLRQHGFKKIALVLAHGGNWYAMQAAAQELTDETDIKVIALNWLPVLTSRYREVLKSTKPEAHSGEGETARMLVSAPELVEFKRMRITYPEDTKVRIAGDGAPTYGGGVYAPVRSFKAVTDSGVKGNPTLATRETGEKIYDIMVDWLCAIIERDLVAG